MNNLVYPIDTVQHSSISQKVETHLIDSNNDGLNLLYEGPKDINNILASKIKNYNIELKKNHSKFPLIRTNPAGDDHRIHLRFGII